MLTAATSRVLVLRDSLALRVMKLVSLCMHHARPVLINIVEMRFESCLTTYITISVCGAVAFTEINVLDYLVRMTSEHWHLTRWGATIWCVLFVRPTGLCAIAMSE